MGGYPCCCGDEIPCECCTDSLPDAYEFTLSTIIDHAVVDCCDCSVFNATFTIEAIGAPIYPDCDAENAGVCQAYLSAPFAGCEIEGAAGDLVVLAYVQKALDGTCRIFLFFVLESAVTACFGPSGAMMTDCDTGTVVAQYDSFADLIDNETCLDREVTVFLSAQAPCEGWPASFNLIPA